MSKRLARALLTLSLLLAPWAVPTPAAAAPDAPAETTARLEAWLLGEFTAAEKAVTLVNAVSPARAEAAIQAAGAPVLASFDAIGFAATVLTREQLDVVAAQPGVLYLQGNRPMVPAGNTHTATTRVDQGQGLWADHANVDLDGSGVGIAVIDSGAAGDHEMFLGPDGLTRLLNIKQTCVNFFVCTSTFGDEEEEYFTDMTGLDTDLMATGGHGTHVTAIAGGAAVVTENGVPVRGVATGASLYTLGAGAAIFTFNAAASLNWVLEHHDDPCGAFETTTNLSTAACAPIKVVNNSYGPAFCGTGESNCSAPTYDPDDVYVRYSERLVLDGVTVVWAAGNGGSTTDPDPPANDGTVDLTNNAGNSPLPGVLGVANYNDGGAGSRDNALNASSSRGQRDLVSTYPDIAAPGTSILAACRPWLAVCSSGYPDPNYGEITGTSMAAPHIAGIVALLNQADPTLTPGQIEDLLEDTAHQWGDSTRYVADTTEAGQIRNGNHTTSFDTGHGLADLTAALIALSNGEIADPGYGLDCLASEYAADEVGDATGVFGLANVPTDANEPGLDIVAIGADLSDDESVVTFSVEVDDLDVTPPTASSGEYLRYDFTYGELTAQFIISRDAGSDQDAPEGSPVAPSEDRILLIPDLVDSLVIARNLAGSFDAESDLITVEVPVGLLVALRDGDPDAIATHEPDEGAGAVVPASVTPFAAGDEISGVSVIAQRQIGVPGGSGATSTTDAAEGGCAFVLAGLVDDGGGGTGGGDGKVKDSPGHDPNGSGNSENAPGHDPNGPGNSNKPEGKSKGVSAGSGLALATVMLAGGLAFVAFSSRRRRLPVTLGATTVGLVALAVIATAVPADAETLEPVVLRSDETVLIDVTIAAPNVENGCPETTADSSCVRVPATADLPAGELQWVEISAIPTGEFADSTDLDVYLVTPGSNDTTDAPRSANAPIPTASTTETVFVRVDDLAAFDVLVNAYANLPGATYTIEMTAFSRPTFID